VVEIMIAILKENRGAVGAKSIIVIVLLSFFMIFILQNTQVVEIKFLFWQMTLSRVILLFGALFIGVIVGLFIGWEASVKRK
jgi:uncharacterized integral membrane protein